jgi:hypothetical protein
VDLVAQRTRAYTVDAVGGRQDAAADLEDDAADRGKKLLLVRKLLVHSQKVRRKNIGETMGRRPVCGW